MTRLLTPAVAIHIYDYGSCVLFPTNEKGEGRAILALKILREVEQIPVRNH